MDLITPVVDESCHVASPSGINAALETAGTTRKLDPHHLHVGRNMGLSGVEH